MKRIFIIALSVLLLLSLFGCGSKSAKISSVDDLPGKTIGVQENTTGDIYASDYEEQGSTIERYSKGNDAIQALLQGKIDCVIIDSEPAKAFVAANAGKLKILDEPFELEYYAICVAKNNTELKDSINEALRTLDENGTLKNIIDSYISGTDYKYTSPENVDRSKGELVMATNAYFPPYEYYEGGEITGIDADIALAICDLLGYSLRIEDMEFNSIIAAVQTGKADFGMAGMTVTEDRLKNVDFTDTYATATQVIIVQNN
ncbi:MAG TPA: transporter substrate-binding domain-containing protein [Clostridiales bacterium]|jgi:ABC-type amino acid transport substrate-binding protein|nr:transporter substrate-binding domain-containing protein [Clostridiales bacterium]